jgi:hypothetical protein
VRDAVNLARRDTPAVALVTTEFWAQGDFIARSAGMPDVPRVQLPHPVASTGREHMRQVARDIRDRVVAAFAGTSVARSDGADGGRQGPPADRTDGGRPEGALT